VSGAATSRSVPLFLQVTDYISRHLGEPGLETASVARAHHLSVRYLQAIFAEQGTTVTGWIRERRLAGCRRDLADPALTEEPIGDVAARWGYPDQAYFSRLFRRTFDETPREWRARAASLLKVLRLRLRGNVSGAATVSCYVRSLLMQDVTVAGLYRRGTGRWGVALAVFIAVALTVGLSAALAVTRIDNGTDALGGLAHIVTSVSASSASAGH